MLEILIGSSVLIVVLALLRVILRGCISARVQYALWGLVALRLLVPVSLFSAPVSASAVAAPIEKQIVAYSDERRVTVEYPVTMGRAPDTGEVVQAVARDSVEPLDVLRWLWYGGMALTGAWFCYVNLRMAYRLRKGRKMLSMDAPVPVYVAPRAASPCLFGLIKPAIYLTEQAASDGEQARQIVAHELSHLRHGDCVWALVRGICLVVWWFDPLVWLAAALSRRDCELACDEATVRSLGEALRYDYGRTLLGMATVKTGAATLLCAATTMTGGKSALAERIRSLAKPKNSVPLCIAALVLALVAAGCAFTGGEGPETTAATEPMSMPQSEEILGTYSDALWRIYDELDAFSYGAAVSLECADESVAASYREHCLPTTFCSFADIVHCTDSWTAEYDIPVELAETPDAQITITSKAGDELYIRSDTDNIYVRRADGTIDGYTGLGSRYMLENLWCWANALSAPLIGEEIVMPVVSQQLFFLLFPASADFDPNEAAYWYCSDTTVAWWMASDWSMHQGTLSVNFADAAYMDTVLAVYNAGDCYIGCTDAEGHPLACWHIVGEAADADTVTGAAYWNALSDFRSYSQWAAVEIEPADYQPPADTLAMELPLMAGTLMDMGSWNMRYVDRAELPLDEAEHSIHLKAADWNLEIWVCDSMDGVLMQTDQYTVFAETPLYTGAELVDMLVAWARDEAALYQQWLDA